MNNKLFLVMPAYNEEANIEKVVKEWLKILDYGSNDSKFVIADSGSVDNTHQILEKLKINNDKIIILNNTLKQHGPKLIALYKYAIENNADYIFQTDSDGQTDPNEFISFWQDKNKYDAILGYRRVRQDGIIRKFVENVVCFLLNIYFGVKVKDANAPFRLMKSSVVAKYIDRFDEDYNLPNIMLTCFMSYYGDNIEFKEVTFKKRQGGVNSIDLRKIVKIGLRALKDFTEFKKKM